MALASKQHIAKYILAFGSVQGMSILINVVRTKLVALLLGPNGMGIMALYSSSIQLLQNVCNLGLDKSGVPSVSQAYENGDEKVLRESIKLIRSWFLLAGILAVLVCIAFSWLLSYLAFSNYSKILHFIFLSPTAGFLIVAAGEFVVLKATRKLRRVAILSLWGVVITLIVSVPLFFFFGSHAIILSLLLTALIQLIVAFCFSYKVYKPQISFKKNYLKAGIPMIKFGISYIIAGGLGSGAEFLIRSFLNTHGGDSIVGLYNAGYMLSITYTGMVFAAIDSEYFPRLSALCTGDNAKHEIRSTITRQIKVSLMFIVPMVIVLYFVLPWIVPLLFSSKFVEAVPMAQITIIAMIGRAIMLPIEYLPLAKSDSNAFLVLESIYDVLLAIGVCLGFVFYGLEGTGMAIVAVTFICVVCDIVCVKYRYGISML